MGLKLLGTVLFIVLLFASPARANSATVGDISKELVCQCGCLMLLNNCSHAECGSREAMTAVIEQKLAQGQSEEKIIQFFVAQYGEQVLAAPPKRGFNLMAWLLPFLAILGGGGAIYLAIRAWLGQGRIRHTDAVPETEEEDEKYQHRLKQELDEFTERGFR